MIKFSRQNNFAYGWAVLVVGVLLGALGTSDVWALTTNFTTRSGKSTSTSFVIEKPLSTLTVGERLSFDVFWMGAHVGLGTLEVKERVKIRGREAFHVVAIARTNDFLSKLYPVEDEVHSFIDADKHCSLEFRRNVKEGRYRADERLIFDHENRKGYYESFLNKGKKEVDILPYVQDILSSFYWFRLQELVPGQSVRTIVSTDEKSWNIEIEVLGQEVKEIRGMGAVPTIKVEPKTSLKGVPYQKGRAWVYFSTDSRRLPVWISIKTPFGPVHGVLRAIPD